jgi:hypothetical protein
MLAGMKFFTSASRRRLSGNVLLLLLLPFQARSAAPFFNIMDYGAHNDGSTPSTDAIRSAIQAAKTAGGGTVYVPPDTNHDRGKREHSSYGRTSTRKERALSLALVQMQVIGLPEACIHRVTGFQSTKLVEDCTS